MKTALVTGASRGIGKALAERLLQEGYFVIGTSRDGLTEWEHERLTMIALELSEAESINACAKAVKQLGRGIDMFINSAGIFDERDAAATVDSEVLRATLEVNLIGPITFTEQIVPLLNDGAKVVNITSRWGSCQWTHDMHYSSYSISKAGLNMYTRKLALRLKEKATVFSVHPGSVVTDMNPDGEISTQESAEDIFKLTQSAVETGQFWFKGEQFPW